MCVLPFFQNPRRSLHPTKHSLTQVCATSPLSCATTPAQLRDYCARLRDYSARLRNSFSLAGQQLRLTSATTLSELRGYLLNFKQFVRVFSS